MRQASVFGSSRLRPGDTEYEDARRLGTLLAEDGWRVATGGYAGVMEAASRGASEAGGEVLGVTISTWSPRITANRWLSEEIACDDIFDRLRHLIASDALIAVAGGVGTLAELALAWNLMQPSDVAPRPVIAMGPRWKSLMPAFGEHLIDQTADREIVRLAADPEAVMDLLRA